MNLHKRQLYLLEQHSEAFIIWSAIFKINTEGKSLIMKLGPGGARKPKNKVIVNWAQEVQESPSTWAQEVQESPRTRLLLST